MTLVDTNILIDIVSDDPVWGEWSTARLEEADLAGQILTNDIIYSEFSLHYESVAETDDALAKLGIEIEAIPGEALFLAARAFRAYRRTGGTRTGVLSDFFIGAHAAVAGRRLLTRDPRRYRAYFPTLELIAPR